MTTFDKTHHWTLNITGKIVLPDGTLLSEDKHQQFAENLTTDPLRLLRRCNGQFTCSIVDNRSGDVMLISDPFGSFALHYSITGTSIVYGLSAKDVALRSGNTLVNETALAEFLGFGQTFDYKSLFTGVMRLAPGTVLTYRSGSYDIKKYFTLSLEKAPRQSFAEITRLITDGFLQSVNELLRSDAYAATLSGGFDSRMIAAALVHLDRKDIPLYTHGKAGSYDMIIASQIARDLGFRHERVVFTDEYFASLGEVIPTIITQTECAYEPDSAAVIHSWHHLAPYRNVIEGHGGPLYRRQILRGAEYRKGTRHIAEFIFDSIGKPLLASRSLNPDAAQFAEDSAREGLRSFFRQFPDGTETGDMIDLFYLNEMCADHYGIRGNYQIGFFGIAHPLLTQNNLSMIFSLPSRYRMTNALPKHIIHTLCPALEKYPLDNSGYRVPYRGYRYMRYVRRLMSPLGAKRRQPYSITDLSLKGWSLQTDLEEYLETNLDTFF